MFRPLRIGEIFHRAISIYTENFVVFTSIVLTLLVPVTIVQYFGLPDQSQSIGAHPFAGYPPAKIMALVGSIGIMLLLAPFVNNAVAVGVAAVYFQKKPDYRSSFTTVLRRWPSILTVALLTLSAIIGAYAVGAFVLAIMFVIGAQVAHQSIALAAVLFFVAVVCALALVLLLMLMLVCYAFAEYSVSLEEIGATRAIGNAFERIVNKQEVGKASLMALSYFGIEVVVLIISATVGMILLSVTHSSLAQLAANVLVGAMLTSFLTILLAVYYYDVRTRREGLDIEADLQRLTA
jgi:hypothetical protein